jgi:hypothetical protein
VIPAGIVIERGVELGSVVRDELRQGDRITHELMRWRPLGLGPDDIVRTRVRGDGHGASVAVVLGQRAYDGGVDTSGLTEVGFTEIVQWSILIGVAAVIAYWVYRSMDHPLLALTQTPAGPRATRRALVTYILVTPLLVTAWWTFFSLVFIVNENPLNPAQIVIFPIALIIAIRTLAFIAPRAAHELAKVIPIALVAFVILGGNIRNTEEMGETLDQIAEIEITLPALLLLFAYDYLLTAIWYWGWIRGGQPRWQARRSGKHVADGDGGIAVLADADGADGRA